MNYLKKIKDCVERDIASGGTIDDLLRSTMEELGEFSTACSIENGYKNRKLEEPAVSEAIDLIICSLALYFAKNGKIEDLEQNIDKKLNKWNKKINEKFCGSQE